MTKIKSLIIITDVVKSSKNVKHAIMSHCFPISSTIDFNRVNFPMCFEMGKQSPIHIHKHNLYISFFDLKICGVNK